MPIEYQVRPSQRRTVQSRASKVNAFPPFALGEVEQCGGAECDATPSANAKAPSTAPPSADVLRASIKASADGNVTRIAAAFAKRDGERQGLLAPSDFAAAMRELGVALDADAASAALRDAGVTHAQSDGATSGDGGAASSHHHHSLGLSGESIDYMKVVASLEPPPSAAAAQQAEATAGSIGVPALATSATPPPTAAGMPLMRGSEAAGGVDRRRHVSEPPQTAKIVGASTATGVDADGDGMAADAIVAAVPSHAAGRNSTIGVADVWLPYHRRSRGGTVPANSSAETFAALGGPEYGRGTARPARRPSLRRPSHRRTATHELVFGRGPQETVTGAVQGSMDEAAAAAATPAAATPAAAEAVAAGLTSEAAAAAFCCPAHVDPSPSMPTSPHRPPEATCADVTMYGERLGPMHPSPPRPELERCRRSGAAGQYPPQNALDRYGARRNVAPPQRDGAVATTLSAWGSETESAAATATQVASAGDERASARACRRAAVGRGEHAGAPLSRRAAVGPPPQPSPLQPLEPQSTTAPLFRNQRRAASQPASADDGRWAAPRAAAGMPTARCDVSTSPRNVAANSPRASGAAGRAACQLSASERLYGGQISAMGGLA